MIDGKFTAYTKETTADQVAALFEQRHGYTPDQVEDAGAVWLVGPLGENGNGRQSLTRRAEAERAEMTPERARQLALEWEAIT